MTGRVRWLILGVGTVVVAVLPLSACMARGAEGPGTTTDNAAVSEFVQAEITKGGGSPAAPRRDPADEATLMAVAEVVTVQGVGPAASRAGPTDAATLMDSAEANIVRAQPPPTGGGDGESAQVQESVAFVVRDADGNIKEQGIAN